ncbi:MAG TPA: hypothetical protein VGG28_11490 [Kofleriaceae bacterium]|jgi:hypothetical protein
MGSRLQVTIATLGMVAARSASADDTLIENKPQDRAASTGFLAEGGLGAVAFLPKVNKDAGVGPELELRVGRDVFSWFSLDLFAAASTHEATLPPPPTGQYFQLYRAGADGRLNLRFNAIGIFAEGGVGAAMVSSNVLEPVDITKPGQRFSIQFHGGVGVEYQLENRHYGIGIAVDGFLVPQFSEMKAIASRLYLRYTYGGG